MKEIQPGIFREKDRLFTENSERGETVYGEDTVSRNGGEYREWKPGRSKAAAAVEKGVELGIERDSEILYLGAASGTTVSHLSDIVRDGFIVAVELSRTVAQDLVSLAEGRENIAPVIADAREPSGYAEYVEDADVVYQDIAQRDQAEILAKNCDRFLESGDIALVAVKARSVSSTRDPGDVFDEVRGKLEKSFEILDETGLEPHESDHLFLKLEKK